MDIELFFLPAPHLFPLYDALARRIREACGDFSVNVRRTQLSLMNRRLFSCVSLPPARKTKIAGHIILTLGPPRRVESPRIAVTTEPYPGRWTHHIHLKSEADIDEELMGWLREAYAFAEIK